MTADPPRCTYSEAIDATARRLASVAARLSTLTAEQWAREAYRPGGPSVDELAARIRAKRAATVTRAAA